MVFLSITLGETYLHAVSAVKKPVSNEAWRRFGKPKAAGREDELKSHLFEWLFYFLMVVISGILFNLLHYELSNVLLPILLVSLTMADLGTLGRVRRV